MCPGVCHHGILNAVFAIQVSKDQSTTIFIILGLLAFVAAFVMTFVVIVKLVRWRKKGTLDVPVSTVPTAPAP